MKLFGCGQKVAAELSPEATSVDLGWRDGVPHVKVRVPSHQIGFGIFSGYGGFYYKPLCGLCGSGLEISLAPRTSNIEASLCINGQCGDRDNSRGAKIHPPQPLDPKLLATIFWECGLSVVDSYLFASEVYELILDNVEFSIDDMGAICGGPMMNNLPRLLNQHLCEEEILGKIS